MGNFRNLAVDPTVEVVKTGRTSDNEVDAISGATISSQAVVKIINASNERWMDRVTALTKAAGNGGGPE